MEALTVTETDDIGSSAYTFEFASDYLGDAFASGLVDLMRLGDLAALLATF